MIGVYLPNDAGMVTGGAEAVSASALWVDLVNPSPDEILAVETATGTAIPARDSMEEIEASSRMIRRKGSLVMTVPILTGSTGGSPRNSAVTFILSSHRLVTVRYDTPRAFDSYIADLHSLAHQPTSPGEILLGVVEAIIDRIADLLEELGRELDAASHRIFHQPSQQRRHHRASSRELEALLRTIGRDGDLSGRARETLLGLRRMAAFLPHTDDALGVSGAHDRVETIGHDLQSLSEYVDFLGSKTNFLLDATLGVINIQQNQVIKLFTIMSVLFLPPTLVASWYGMNFKAIPELQWDYGYPYAIALAVLAAALPYWIFKRKGWM
ncbi:Mg2+ and Co2+ transporters [Candidatus Terasakiella magnetica]|nr:Mg2+ and Co2+ transporters [Candidatus Terasakiella magnetica]